MANFTSKVSIFYDYKGRGFSETLWSSLGIDTLASTEVKKYLALRLAIMDDDAQAVYARISDGSAPRRVRFMDLVTENWAGKLDDNGSAPDDAIDVRLTGVSNTTSHLFLHAFPAKFVKEKNLVNLGSWSSKFTAWAQYLADATNGWRLRFSTGNTLANRKLMSGVTPDSVQRGFLFTTAAASGLVPGDVIAVGGAPSKTVGYRGRKIVTNVSDDQKTMKVGGVSPVGTVPDATMYYCKLAFPQENIKSVYALALTERKTGQVFGQPAGRRPNVLPLRR